MTGFCSTFSLILTNIMSNFDFTDKAQESVAAAIQLAKDYANAQGMAFSAFRLDKKLTFVIKYIRCISL